MSSPLQQFSHYPSWPAPVRVPLVTFADHPCVYLPGKTMRTRAMIVDRMPAELYHDFMDAGFRRSGRLIYQPVCPGCRACLPIRVLVERFHPGKSHRRCLRKNSDLSVTVDRPAATDEKHDLYCRYLRQWHGRDGEDLEREDFESFLYDSPVNSIEFTCRDRAGRLLAVGICDLTARLSLSSVYCYFDPDFAKRALGVFSALTEIEYARSNGIPYYYLGYWVRGCRAMEYKSDYGPHQKLCTDAVWRE